ncbi:helix-turn-helix domain-containing protein [Sphingomonas sp. DT-51]|uniref:helix-turn-helix domain-containing protein n=1 Tax=Sphingomonas sp. DT-51 TaxID=3396165 RepID=UPI003F1D7685
MSVPDWQISGTMAAAQRDAILAALLATDNNLTHAAQRLRIGRTTLYRLIKSYDIIMTERVPRRRVAAGGPRGIDGHKDGAASRVILVDGAWYLVPAVAQAS